MRYRGRSFFRILELRQFGCILLQMAHNERRKRRVIRWSRQADRIDAGFIMEMAMSFAAKDYRRLARTMDKVINASTKQRRYTKAPYGTLPIRLVWETETYDKSN